MKPIEYSKDGIIIRSEMLEKDKIYTCIHEDRVFLFFKNEMGILSCYEVIDYDIIEKIKANPDPEYVKHILSMLINND